LAYDRAKPDTGPVVQDKTGPNAADISLRVLATTDLHAYLLPFDYFKDSPTNAYGLTRTARLIAEARLETPNVLLFDNGDFLQGSALGDYLARGRTRLPHPMMRAFQLLGYDAGTLGNHEFNYGLPFLSRVLAQAHHPVVCANVMYRQHIDPLLDQHFVPPYVILNRQMSDSTGRLHDIKVGVIGLTPPQILQWDRQHLDGRLLTRGMTEAARIWVPRLRIAGADIVVALAHTGIAVASSTGEQDEDCALEIATIPGIDAIIAGHSHLAFPGPDHPAGPGIDPVTGMLWDKPTVLPGHYGSHLGIIDLTLRQGQNGKWRVADAITHLRTPERVAMTTSHPEVSKAVQNLESATIGVHRATRRWIRRDIGVTDRRLHSYFALISDSLTLSVMAMAQSDYVRAALARTDHADLPILSAVAPFKAGGRSGPANYVDIPAGPLALRHAADLCPYPNTVSALRVTGAELADWLERSVSIYHQIAPGSEGAGLVNDDFASFQHDRIFGISYEIDLAAAPRYGANGMTIHPASSRIRNLEWQGRAVQATEPFVLVTNSFRSGGAGFYVNDAPAHVVLETKLQSRDMLARQITAWGGVRFSGPQTWRFCPMADTSALVETAPQAMDCLGDAGPLDLSPAGHNQAGFQMLRLRL
jgi:2',3'-cyclic-nucleotide 2'-phosphodiesterase / 3'-nucleotidase